MDRTEINVCDDQELIQEKKEPSRIYLVLFVLFSFLFHFFINTFPSYVFVISEILLVSLFLFSKPIRANNNLLYFWIIAFIFIFVSFLNSGRENQALFNVITIFCGIVLLVGYSEQVNTYQCVLKWIVVLSVFFAFGVLLQLFWPDIYLLVLNLFPQDFAYAVISRTGEEELELTGTAGFTTNPGFSAGYIVAGLFAYVSLHYKEIRIKHVLVILFLVFAMLCTGKRAHALFFVLAILFSYIALSPNYKLLSRFIKVLVIALIVFFVYNQVSDYLVRNIPFFAELLTTQEGLNEGEDITSGRTILYEQALKLYQENPVFGIGWRQFRKTTSSLMFSGKSMDTHNVYLQLLCETGIVGLIFIIPAFLAFWFKTLRSIRQLDQDPDDYFIIWKPLLWFSFIYQTFFLMYGLTGNVLYDCHYETMYFFSCSILIAYLCVTRLNNEID